MHLRPAAEIRRRPLAEWRLQHAIIGGGAAVYGCRHDPGRGEEAGGAQGAGAAGAVECRVASWWW